MQTILSRSCCFSWDTNLMLSLRKTVILIVMKLYKCFHFDWLLLCNNSNHEGNVMIISRENVMASRGCKIFSGFLWFQKCEAAIQIFRKKYWRSGIQGNHQFTLESWCLIDRLFVPLSSYMSKPPSPSSSMLAYCRIMLSVYAEGREMVLLNWVWKAIIPLRKIFSKIYTFQ